jgi:hypothetical protein
MSGDVADYCADLIVVLDYHVIDYYYYNYNYCFDFDFEEDNSLYNSPMHLYQIHPLVGQGHTNQNNFADRNLGIRKMYKYALQLIIFVKKFFVFTV